MITITPLQEIVLLAIIEQPGMKLGDIKKIAVKNPASHLETLINKELVERDGERMKFRFYPTGLDYYVTENGQMPVVNVDVEAIEDPRLKQIATVRFTAEQLAFVKANKHLTRKELARKLGMSKVEFNCAMERR